MYNNINYYFIYPYKSIFITELCNIADLGRERILKKKRRSKYRAYDKF